MNRTKLSLKPGDVAWMTGLPGIRDAGPTTVDKVGRVYITTSRGRFTIEGYGEYGLRLFESKQAYDELRLKERLWAAIRDAGTGYQGQGVPDVSVDVLQQIAGLLGLNLEVR